MCVLKLYGLLYLLKRLFIIFMMHTVMLYVAVLYVGRRGLAAAGPEPAPGRTCGRGNAITPSVL